jgi:hypothetical protein
VKRHRHQDFIRFLSVIDERTPKDLDLHTIVDNYATHKHPEAKKWLALILGSVCISRRFRRVLADHLDGLKAIHSGAPR